MSCSFFSNELKRQVPELLNFVQTRVLRAIYDGVHYRRRQDWDADLRV